tara:strand:+ start:176 stop:808 length:633 start_codon:yes stop_codon:yes gene_type:complete
MKDSKKVNFFSIAKNLGKKERLGVLKKALESLGLKYVEKPENVAAKENPESIRQMFGLVGLTVIIILSFMILNVFFGAGDKTAEGSKVKENNETVVASLPKGRLNFFEGNEGYKLSPSEYKAVCKNTKIVVQRAMIGANITDYEAKKLYFDNGNKIDKFSVKWDDSVNKCFAEYIIRALQGTSETITVSGEAKGFLKTSIDTRVYFIKNF